MSKPLNIQNIAQAKQKINDIEVFGNGDLFRLMSKASSKSGNWMKSTKVMEIEGAGCVVQVTTQQGDNVAEALTFVPFTKVEEDENGNLKLVSNNNFVISELKQGETNETC